MKEKEKNKKEKTKQESWQNEVDHMFKPSSFR